MPERDQVIDPILLAISGLGGRAFRNNSGIAFHKDGSAVKYGVAMPGGSDIIGWMPRLIGGVRVAQFLAIEAKTGRQRPTEAQQAFLRVVREAGGLATWGNDPETILSEIRALRR